MSNNKIISKKLKAIVFTDIVNFTQISADDERYALELIDKQRDIMKPIVEKYSGEWLKEIGDGVLISFDSSLDAVQCSIEIQKVLKDVDNFSIRIGIHQGDIFIKDGDVYGDDVNIASRVEGFSPEGGISLSDKVHKDISGVKEIKTAFIGHKKLKGVEQETKIRCVVSDDLPKHKTNFFAKSVSYATLVIGLQYLLLFLILVIIYVYRGGTLPLGVSEAYAEEHLNDTYILFDLFQDSALLLLIGYSCLSFMKGVSIKSQKGFLYFAYLYFLYYVYDFYTALFVEDNPLDLSDFGDILIFILMLSFLFIIPLLLMYISKYLFNKMKKNSEYF